MPNLIAFLLISSVFLIPCRGQTTSNFYPRRLKINYATEPVTINAILSEWGKYDSVLFQSWHKRGDKDNSVSVKMTWDKHKLYLAYRVWDTQLNARYTENDQAVWEDDCIELYIGTTPAQESENRLTASEHQFVVNINNAFSTIAGGDSSWEGRNFKWETDVFSAVKMQGTPNDNSDIDSGYIVEMAINWTSIGYVPKINDTLLFDLCVEDRDDSLNLYPFDLSFLPGHFAQPKRWWKLILLDDSSAVSDTKKRTGVFEKNTGNISSFIWFYCAVGIVMVSFLIFILIKRRNPPGLINPMNDNSNTNVGKPSNLLYYDELVKKTIHIIEEEYKKELNTGYVAEQLHLSERQLQRILKKNTGKRFRQYLNEVRIKKSIELLKDEALSINEIAFEIGYQSYTHFNRIFKFYNQGVSPKKFREQNRQNEETKTTL